MKTPPFAKLDLIQLSVQEGAVHLDNQVILIDNFDTAPEQINPGMFFVNHPVKLSFMVALFCLKGRMQFRINLQEFELRENDVLIAQKGWIGEFLGMNTGTRIAVIAFDSEYFQFTGHVEASMALQRMIYSQPLCHLKPEVIEECMTIYRLMKAKIKETDNPFRKGSLLGYMQALTCNSYNYLLASDNDDKRNKTLGQGHDLYTRFMREVQKNYTKERSVSYYADILCITPKYLSQVVHRVSGRFAGEWITDYVILEAKALLKSRKYTIQQISDMLNFANQSFFGKYFKNKVGCSPSAYQHTDDSGSEVQTFQ